MRRKHNPLPIPIPSGEGDHTHTLPYSILAPLALDLYPQIEILAIPLTTITQSPVIGNEFAARCVRPLNFGLVRRCTHQQG